MRHRRRGKHLGRTPAHRRALRRNLASSLILHERIRTTLAKAKEVRPFIERLVTLARKGTLAHFRRALALLNDKRMVQKLFREIGPRYKDRPGGYVRILRLADEERRLGDNAPQAIIEFVGAAPAATPPTAAAGSGGQHAQVEEDKKKE